MSVSLFGFVSYKLLIFLLRFLFFLLVCKSFLYILDISHLSVLDIITTFSYYIG